MELFVILQTQRFGFEFKRMVLGNCFEETKWWLRKANLQEVETQTLYALKTLEDYDLVLRVRSQIKVKIIWAYNRSLVGTNFESKRQD